MLFLATIVQWAAEVPFLLVLRLNLCNSVLLQVSMFAKKKYIEQPRNQ